MSWWKPSWIRMLDHVHAPAARRSTRPTASGSSVKPPLPSQGKEKVVPPMLRAAMATVQTGDFIFDPVQGR